MIVYIYHTIGRNITRVGKFKTLNGALKRADKSKQYWKEHNIDWMRVWIGEDSLNLREINK